MVQNETNMVVAVLVETHKKHAKYGKRVQYIKKYKAHDEENTAKVGDIVLIEETKPLSATKHFRLVKVVARAEDVK